MSVCEDSLDSSMQTYTIHSAAQTESSIRSSRIDRAFICQLSAIFFLWSFYSMNYELCSSSSFTLILYYGDDAISSILWLRRILKASISSSADNRLSNMTCIIVAMQFPLYCASSSPQRGTVTAICPPFDTGCLKKHPVREQYSRFLTLSFLVCVWKDGLSSDTRWSASSFNESSLPKYYVVAPAVSDSVTSWSSYRMQHKFRVGHATGCDWQRETTMPKLRQFTDWFSNTKKKKK